MAGCCWFIPRETSSLSSSSGQQKKKKKRGRSEKKLPLRIWLIRMNEARKWRLKSLADKRVALSIWMGNKNRCWNKHHRKNGSRSSLVQKRRIGTSSEMPGLDPNSTCATARLKFVFDKSRPYYASICKTTTISFIFYNRGSSLKQIRP